MSDHFLTQPAPQLADHSIVSLNQKTIFIVLVAISCTLVLVSFIGVAILSPYSGNPYAGDPSESTPSALAKLVLRFDVIAEGNIPSGYSGAILLISAVLLLVIAIDKYRQRDRFRWHWLVLSGLFVLFSLDEVAYLHEGISNLMTQRSLGILQLGWTIPATVFVLGVGIFFAPFLLRLPPNIRRLFIIAASLFLTGALVLEVIERLLLEAFALQSVLLIAINHLQDLCEMQGVAVLIYALLAYIRNHMGPVQLQIR
jgi:hypothetical protein